MALVTERLALAEQIGATKRVRGLPIRNYGTETEVLARYREAAAAAGLEPEFGEGLAGMLIAEAVRRQEEGLGPTGNAAAALEVLILGGAGKMGLWFTNFFRGQGHRVLRLDPALPAGSPDAASGIEAVDTADVILLAMPLSLGPELLETVLARNPRGLVVDISSLKSHLIGVLREGAAHGLRVASLHPLFGPGVRTLAGRIMAVCDCGNPAAADQAAGLFADTAVTLVRHPIEEHDQFMQYVLGLSHAVSLLFATTLAHSGRSYQELAALASTTFLKQVRTAGEVVRENPAMYHEIQHLNHHTPALFRLLAERLDTLQVAATADDPAPFVALMEEARRYFPDTVETALP